MDENGKELARGHTEALGDWMTADFVPFRAFLTFEKQINSTQGILVLEKDNPPGLSENADEIRIPVRF